MYVRRENKFDCNEYYVNYNNKLVVKLYVK